MKNIYDLKIHQFINVSEYVQIVRVPGGWIYSFNQGSEVFVPYCEIDMEFYEGIEFKKMEKPLQNDTDNTDDSNTFTEDELKTIQTDIIHIYSSTELKETEVHKRNLILNKLKSLLGPKYHK
jgi:hypothetical protein